MLEAEIPPKQSSAQKLNKQVQEGKQLPNGFMQPVKNMNAVSVVQSKASSPELDAQLSILKNPNATDSEKIDAVGQIVSIFAYSGAASQSDATATFEALSGFFGSGSNSSIKLKLTILNSLEIIFSSSAPLSTQDVENAINFLHGTIFDPAEDISIRSAAIECIGSLPGLLMGKLALTEEQFISIASDICNVLKNPNSASEMISAAKGGLVSIPTYSDSMTRAVLPQLADLAAHESSAPPDIKLLAGSCVSEVCFKNPYLFDQPTYGELFNLDSGTAKRMIADSPDWQKKAVNGLTLDDYHMIYKLAASHPNEPIVKTLFEQCGITYFGLYPQKILERQYDNRNSLTGKPIWVVLGTKEKGTTIGGVYEEVPFGSYLKPEYADSHDVRIFESKTDVDGVQNITSTLQKLGLEPAKEPTEASGSISFDFHGTPFNGLLSIDGPFGPIMGANMIDIGDKALFKKLRGYFKTAFFQACSVGSRDYPFSNLTYEFAKDTGTRAFGAQVSSNGDVAMTWKGDFLEDVNYDVPRNMYDFSSIAPLDLISYSASRNSDKVQISFEDKSGNASAYAVQKLVNGDFETVGIIDGKDGERNYVLSINDSGASATYRIMRIDSTDGTIVPGSKNYSFSVSASFSVGESKEHEEFLENSGKFVLEQNYPNPASKSTTIEYWLSDNSKVYLNLYDLTGRLVENLVNGQEQSPGIRHSVHLDTSNLASGVYFYTIRSGQYSESKKMLVVK